MHKMTTHRTYHSLLIALALLWIALPAHAQRYPERREVRKGNRAFEREAYDGSVERYRRALSLADSCWEASYNLGNALYKREMRLMEQDTLTAQQPPMGQPQEDVSARFDEAVELLERAAADSLRSPLERAEAYYNLGGVRFAQQKLQESLESLRNSLRLNPQDEDAKFNYTFVKRLLEQQQQQQQNDQNQQGGGEENQQNDQQQNKQQQDNQQQNNQQQEQNQNNQNDQNDPQQQQPQEQQPQEGMISPQEQEQMLEAIQAQEDETQEKLKERRGVVVRGSKNW